MLNLAPDLSPVWLDVASGVRIHLKAAESAMLLAGRAASSAVILEGGSREDAEFAFTAACLIWGALAWEGVGDEAGQNAEMTAQNLTRLLKQNFDVFEKVDRAYVLPILLRDNEKNASSPSLNGTTAAAKPTATRARNAAKNAPTTKTAAKRTKARGSGK